MHTVYCFRRIIKSGSFATNGLSPIYNDPQIRGFDESLIRHFDTSDQCLINVDSKVVAIRDSTEFRYHSGYGINQ